MIDGGVTNAYENFNRGAALNPLAPCLGHRVIDSNGQAGPFVWQTYQQTIERRDAIASGLINLSLCPLDQQDGMRKLAIFSKNRPEWVLVEQACFCQSIVTVPLYDTSLPPQLSYIVSLTSVPTIVVGGLKELKVVQATLGDCPSLTTIVVMDHSVVCSPTSSDAHGIVSAIRSRGVAVLCLSDVEDAGRKQPVRHHPPSGRDIASFCFTSGTTGEPKGALILHTNLVSNCGSIKRSGIPMIPDDIHLSYLPLPHMFERVVQFSIYNAGGAVGFYQGDTLKIVEDLVALRPTIFPSVPRLLTRVHDKITLGAREEGGIKAALFERALSAKIAGLRQGKMHHPVWDRLVMNKIKAKVGLDRVRAIITGSAPISPHVMDFLRATFGIPVFEGYGQTECTAAATVTSEEDFATGHVGGPLPCNEITLFDVPEMGYLSTDSTHGSSDESRIACRGRGEVCFRGPNVFAGYYRQPDKTAEAIDRDGWLHSGDIGLWLPNGSLKLIDRKKNIFKLSQGEYVAPEKIENILNRSELVAQSFVYGDSLQNSLVAVLVPDAEALEKWCIKRGINLPTHAARCADNRVKTAILRDVAAMADGAKLQGFEKPKAIHLESELWSPENGILTPTFKLKRQQARERYTQEIDHMYRLVNVPEHQSKL